MKRLLLLLSLLLIAQMVQGQVIKPPPKLPPPLGTRHHLTGRVEKRTCPSSLSGAKLQVVEFWYTRPNTTTLVLPTPATSGNLDPLSFTGRPLVQEHILGELSLTSDAATFDVQWLESAPLSRVPWVKNVYNGRTGEYLTVYRLLSLQVNTEAPRNFVFQVDPLPLIMFFGTETTKNVGTLKVDCVPIGG